MLKSSKSGTNGERKMLAFLSGFYRTYQLAKAEVGS